MRYRLLLAAGAVGAVTAGFVPAHAVGGQTLVIWPLGDSITLGASSQPAPGGYRTSLDQMLTHAGVTHRFVGSWTANSSPTLDLEAENRHDGHGGYRVDQIRRDLDGVAHGSTDVGGYWLRGRHGNTALAPDAVLVHLGTNDILQRWDPRRFPTRDHRADLSVKRQRDVFVSDLTARLGDLLARIHALRPHALLVVSTVVPIDKAGFGEAVATYADEVRALTLSLQSRHVPVVLADAYAAFASTAPPGSRVGPGLMCDDGVHPSPAGYAVLARVFATVLEGRNLPVPVSSGARP